jgi:hypothetical protein
VVGGDTFRKKDVLGAEAASGIRVIRIKLLAHAMTVESMTATDATAAGTNAENGRTGGAAVTAAGTCTRETTVASLNAADVVTTLAATT